MTPLDGHVARTAEHPLVIVVGIVIYLVSMACIFAVLLVSFLLPRMTFDKERYRATRPGIGLVPVVPTVAVLAAANTAAWIRATDDDISTREPPSSLFGWIICSVAILAAAVAFARQPHRAAGICAPAIVITSAVSTFLLVQVEDGRYLVFILTVFATVLAAPVSVALGQTIAYLRVKPDRVRNVTPAHWR